MHEMSVCLNLLEMIGRIAAEDGATRVASVEVSIGPLSGVEPGLLARAFEAARRGTVAETARLDVEATGIVVSCAECGRLTEASLTMLTCGHCGNGQTEIRSGRELFLKSVELDIPEAVEQGV